MNTNQTKDQKPIKATTDANLERAKKDKFSQDYLKALNSVPRDEQY